METSWEQMYCEYLTWGTSYTGMVNPLNNIVIFKFVEDQFEEF